MQITLPDDARLDERAAAAGFASVEEYLLQLVERDALQQEPADDHEKASREEDPDDAPQKTLRD